MWSLVVTLLGVLVCCILELWPSRTGGSARRNVLKSKIHEKRLELREVEPSKNYARFQSIEGELKVLSAQLDNTKDDVGRFWILTWVIPLVFAAVVHYAGLLDASVMAPFLPSAFGQFGVEFFVVSCLFRVVRALCKFYST